MSDERLLNAMASLDGKYIKECVEYLEASRGLKKYRHFNTGLAVASIIVLFFVGCIGVKNRSAISDFFADVWKNRVNEKIDYSQLEYLDKISRDIGLSQYVNGVTLSIDSAIIGTNAAYFIITTEGIEYENDSYYFFENYDALIGNNRRGYTFYSLNYIGNETGVKNQWLLKYWNDSFRLLDTGKLNITISAENICRLTENGKKESLITESWKFEFDIPSETTEKVRGISDGNVSLNNDIYEIKLSSTQLSFKTQGSEQEPLNVKISAILKNGAIISSEVQSTGCISYDGKTWIRSYVALWNVPFDIDSIEKIIIGDTLIHNWQINQ